MEDAPYPGEELPFEALTLCLVAMFISSLDGSRSKKTQWMWAIGSSKVSIGAVEPNFELPYESGLRGLLTVAYPWRTDDFRFLRKRILKFILDKANESISFRLTKEHRAVRRSRKRSNGRIYNYNTVQNGFSTAPNTYNAISRS